MGFLGAEVDFTPGFFRRVSLSELGIVEFIFIYYCSWSWRGKQVNDVSYCC